jgi:aldose 1-epimerase
MLTQRLDTAYLVNREQKGSYNWHEALPVARLHSAWSGIQVDIYSDQEAFQIYTCNGQNGKEKFHLIQRRLSN